MRGRPRTSSHQEVVLLTLLVACCWVSGCSRQQESVHEATAHPQIAGFTDADIEVLRSEVRQQTEYLRSIADDLESRSRSGRQIDGEALLSIENQLSSARSRVERIEALLDRIESGSR